MLITIVRAIKPFQKAEVRFKGKGGISISLF